jgi:hypothetical protein
MQTLTEFLEAVGAELRVIEMGRRVQRVPRDTFLAFERAERPWPWPLLRQAWFGLLLHPPGGGAEPHVWFLRLPLDEIGCLVQAAREEFLERLVETLGLDGRPPRPEALGRDNPHLFQPREERMAAFHARVARDLHRPASAHYQPLRRYLGGEGGWDAWQGLGLQGLADLAARLDEEGNERLLAGALPHLPAEPFAALCEALENAVVGTAVAEALLARATRNLERAEPDTGTAVAAVRGAAGARELRNDLLLRTLASPAAGRPEVLAAIAGRCWEALEDRAVRRAFLEALAINCSGQAFFNECLADLLFVPGVQDSLRTALREPDRSPALAAAIGGLFSAYRAG